MEPATIVSWREWFDGGGGPTRSSIEGDPAAQHSGAAAHSLSLEFNRLSMLRDRDLRVRVDSLD